MDFLDRLRMQPSHVKVRYALSIAFGATLIIAAIWTSTLPARLASLETDLSDSSEVTSDFESITEGVSDLFVDTNAQMGAVAESQEERSGGAINEIPSVYDDLRNPEVTEREVTQTDTNAGKATTTVPTPRASSPAISPTSTIMVVPKETVKNDEGNKQPRVILIATTTSQKTE